MTRPLSKILYVEDEPDIQAVAKLALEMVGGFSVHVCGSGEDAVRVATDFAPHLILLDVMMPGMDGPSTMHALRQLKQTAQTPVIFITAKVQPIEIAHYRALGAIDVIAKPFDPMLLSENIREIWEREHG